MMSRSGAPELPAVIVVGAGGHARVVADAVTAAAVLRLAGFVDSVRADRKGELFCGAPVLGGLEVLETAVGAMSLAFVAVGDCEARLDLDGRCLAAGFSRPIVRHPSAVVSASASVEPGTFLAAGSVVGPGVRLGRAVIVNTAASVDHDCEVGDGAHVGPGAHLGGRVRIGAKAWVGIGAVVRDGVRIGEGAVVGAGAVVVKDIPDAVVAYGNPARPVRQVARD